MKHFYLVVFALSMVLMILNIPPIPSELSSADRLAIHHEHWSIQLFDQENSIFGENSAEVKAELVDFLKRNMDRRSFTLVYIFATSAFFGLVGWSREAWLKRSMQMRFDALSRADIL